ncbi:MAG: biotin/lipoyl-containing protein, partial [Bacteroidota bacterium]
MAKVDLIMPKMGESIMEATILNWVKKVGDSVEVDETILEIATDKVDSEIPSPVSGVIEKILFSENDVVEVGKVIAIIATEAAGPSIETPSTPEPVVEAEPEIVEIAETIEKEVVIPRSPSKPENIPASTPSSNSGVANNRFYSPLVRNIATREKISASELDAIPGTGLNGRLTKKDLMNYINSGRTQISETNTKEEAAPTRPSETKAVASASVQERAVAPANTGVSMNGAVDIVQMDRMRKMIANHMVMSKQTSPHVTSFVEADVTNIVYWRNRMKNEFKQKEGDNLTFTPISINLNVDH